MLTRKRRLSILVGVIFCVLGVAASAFAKDDTAAKREDFARRPVQGHEANGKKNVNLTVNRTAVDMRRDMGWAFYSGTACKYRAMSTATVAGATRTLPANTWTYRTVSRATPFYNFTGCTSGELERY